MDIREQIQNLIFVQDRLGAVCEALREEDAPNHVLEVALALIDEQALVWKRELIKSNIQLAEFWKEADGDE
jgi:hypothetical protein